MTTGDFYHRAPTKSEWDQLADTAWGVIHDSIEFHGVDENPEEWGKWYYATVLGVEYKFRWASLDGNKGQFFVIAPTWEFVSRTKEDTNECAVGLLTIIDEDIFRTELLALYFWVYGN